jgi:hypothetical protein
LETALTNLLIELKPTLWPSRPASQILLPLPHPLGGGFQLKVNPQQAAKQSQV